MHGRQQWKLLRLNLRSSLVEASSEGATLAVIFLALELLSPPPRNSAKTGRYPEHRLPGPRCRRRVAQAPRTPRFCPSAGSKRAAC